MKEKLTTFIGDLRTDKRIISFDEAATKQAVILKLLSILGWDTFNIEEVKPEYSVGGKSVDYSLRTAGVNKVFLEVKRIREDLEKHQEQLLGYSFKEGVKLAVLTNGVTWWFYLPLYEGNWEQRRFYTIDILQQEPDEASSKFIDFLCKDNIVTGKAIQNAEEIHKSRKKQTIIKNVLPEAWNKIIFEGNELMINLITETIEKLCGYKPDSEVVKQFLSEYRDQLFISEPPPSKASTSNSSPIREMDKHPRMTKGERTPRPEFRIPILEALIELGGKGKVDEILKKVEIKMKKSLKPVDYEKLPSGIMIRWQNTAQWERLVMVQDNLLRSDSPKGIWEVTEEGKRCLPNYR
ncbi:MAG: hypothetical protein KKA79_04080 [Nanoarchaeota archaeon]|nr:hypothetical protein [Nanoarchaeota archaeon]MCG2718276.1 hypothetical protein [Nanoarchaeota archaeon]